MVPLTVEDAKNLASHWIAAWNAHDLESVLKLYSEDTVIESPLAARLVQGSQGRVEGKQALRDYWTLGLQRNPRLEFRLIEMLMGTEGISLYYENLSTGKFGVEVLLLNQDGKVCKSYAFHPG